MSAVCVTPVVLLAECLSMYAEHLDRIVVIIIYSGVCFTGTNLYWVHAIGVDFRPVDRPGSRHFSELWGSTLLEDSTKLCQGEKVSNVYFYPFSF